MALAIVLIIVISVINGLLWVTSGLPLWIALPAAGICGWFVPDLVKNLLCPKE